MSSPLSKVRTAIERGELSPVYYLTGDEDVLKDEFINHVVDHGVDKGSRDFNVDIRSAGDLDGESLNNLIETPPMLAERRIAVVRNIEQWRKNSKAWKTLHAYLAQPSPTTTLVLIHGAGHDPDNKVAGASTHVHAALTDPDAFRAWGQARASSLGVSLETDAMDHLLHAADYNLSVLASELTKLSAAAGADALTVEQVGDLVGVRRGETPTDWIDAALQRKIPEAIELLDVVLTQPGVTGVRLVMNLGTALIGTRIARTYLDAGESASRARTRIINMLRSRRIWVGSYGEEAKRWVSAASRWDSDGLRQAVEAAYRADVELKSTTLTDEKGTIETMLLSFGARGVPGGST